jgi:hypothetical protein
MVLLTGIAPAENPVPLGPLYHPTGIVVWLNDKKMLAEMRVTKQQEKVLIASAWSWHKAVEPEQLRKITGPDRDARIRALWMQKADEVFALAGKTLKPEQIKRLKQVLLQAHGISLFDHPEIRKALNLNEQQVKKLKAAYEEVKADMGAEITSGRFSRSEARKMYNAVVFSVPERVRELLTPEQRKKLKDLLGEPYAFNS